QVLPSFDCSHFVARPGAGCPVLSSRCSSVSNTGITAMALACGRAGTSQSSAPKDERPMTTVPSGAASTPTEPAVSHAAQRTSTIFLVIDLMACVLSTTLATVVEWPCEARPSNEGLA